MNAKPLPVLFFRSLRQLPQVHDHYPVDRTQANEDREYSGTRENSLPDFHCGHKITVIGTRGLGRGGCGGALRIFCA